MENRYNLLVSFYVEQEDIRERIHIVKLNVGIKQDGLSLNLTTKTTINFLRGI